MASSIADSSESTAEAARRLGRRIRDRRLAHGLNQEDLAELAGVSVRFVGDLERGKETVRLSGVLAVCRVLGLELLR